MQVAERASSKDVLQLLQQLEGAYGFPKELS